MARKRKMAVEDTKKIKKKVCVFCRNKTEWIDYKDSNLLKRYISDRAKIRARRVTGNCVQHQREVALAIRNARELALLPYLQRSVTERGRGSRPEGRRRRDDERNASDDSRRADETDDVAIDDDELVTAGAEGDQ